jgi:hypothetical protein
MVTLFTASSPSLQSGHIHVIRVNTQKLLYENKKLLANKFFRFYGIQWLDSEL